MGRPLHALVARIRVRHQRGAAAVEFALVLLPLLWIVFGIISFGMMLSFRQSLSQAATEGARAAAVQIDATKREGDAKTAVADAMNAVGKTCTSAGMTCTVSLPAACGSGQCITVTVKYAYRANPVIPSPPLVGNALPQNLTYAATVRVS